MIRSSYLGIDETFCAVQGYAGASLINAAQGAALLDPLSAAVCLGGIALIEKLVYELSKRVIPGSTGFLGPIPCGMKNVVSYGVATSVTLIIMEVAGLILHIPMIVAVAGIASASMLAGYGTKRILDVNFPTKSFDEQLQECLNAKTYLNTVLTFRDNNVDYKIRVISNPEKKSVIFRPSGLGSISCRDTFILASDETVPETILTKFPPSSYSILSAAINGVKPLTYTSNPTVE